LPAIIPVVVHHSSSGWTAATDLCTLIDLDAETRLNTSGEDVQGDGLCRRVPPTFHCSVARPHPGVYMDAQAHAEHEVDGSADPTAVFQHGPVHEAARWMALAVHCAPF
jgi:hypothetical protein